MVTHCKFGQNEECVVRGRSSTSGIVRGQVLKNKRQMESLGQNMSSGFPIHL